MKSNFCVTKSAEATHDSQGHQGVVNRPINVRAKECGVEVPRAEWEWIREWEGAKSGGVVFHSVTVVAKAVQNISFTLCLL